MKKIISNIFSSGTMLSVVVYLLACLSPYISPQTFWPMSFLALGFPYLAAGIVLLLIIWLFISKRVSFLLVIVLLFGYKNLSTTFGTHFFYQASARPAGSLRILTWNVRGFDNPSTYSSTHTSIRQRMFDYIRDSAPDIICMQEFTEHYGKGMISNTTELLDLGYNYYYRTDESGHHYTYGYVVSGTAIFSKYPITNSGKIMYNDSSNPEHLCFIDVKMHDRPLRIFSTHFKSLSLDAVLLDSSNRARLHGDSTFIYTASKFEKLKVFPREHAVESKIAKAFMDKSPYPVIFCGDMNSVAASYPYHVMSYRLQDAFLKKSYGFGTTMDSLPKSLRIDYLLIDKRFKIDTYSRNELHLSDHFPQIVDIEWGK